MKRKIEEMEKKNVMRVGYWSIRGLGAPCRMMTMYAGVKARFDVYDVKPKDGGGWDASSWFNTKKDLKKINPLMNLPYVIDGDVIVNQTNAVMAYIGRKLGLWAKSDSENVEVEQLMCEIYDLRNLVVKFAYGRDGAKTTKDGAESLLKNVTGKNGILQKLELWLARGDGTFLVGGHATAPDFHLYELIDQLISMATFFKLPSPVSTYSGLSKFYTLFGSLPKMQPYLKSPFHTLPHNQKMAKFGANPDGSAWEPGQTYDWGNLSGVY
jgi:glutathione S-transferase